MNKSNKYKALSGIIVSVSSLVLLAVLAGCSSSSGGGSAPVLSVQDSSVLEGDTANTDLRFTDSFP